VEIDPVLVEVARAYARRYGVADRVEIREEDFNNTRISDATIVYLYLYSSINERLKPKLERELEPGTRIIAIDFPIPGWIPAYTRRDLDEAGIVRTIRLYVIGLSDTYWTRSSRLVPGEPAALKAWNCLHKTTRRKWK